MSIGERIRYFRNQRGMTQKYLGTLLGFPETSADVRLAQYESETRIPKVDITAALANALDVAPQALTVPDIDSPIGLMHTLFTLVDVYGITVDKRHGEIGLLINEEKGHDLLKLLAAWQEQSAKITAGEISKEDYDKWRYYYPKYDTTEIWAKVPSQELSDTMIKVRKGKFKD